MANSTDVKRQFDEIDTDGNGTISLEELKDYLQKDPKVTDENAAAIIRYADENSDGQIDLDEFAELIRK
ncbi:EF-hand domain-containing protein [Kitasatospora sp. NPDC097643]|uniref:EF-hand domain-containing protein n=1 Tax=Kitasatospora sp. NPDC097643 TaxID=3157230 RepID=UPI00332E9A1D